ncbi:ATP-grasp fold amidoligase family protein [Fibrobacter sp. UWP2]|uniref:ATP-grasp fold amidoligase family protein n=1 Tax=Fibrobacter sp. UWP2 TaxID=1896216 RepID=UPI00091E70DB|nr:ATP-grasp fold amidoligase family protein [Fibrobacter sp. UWP2]SHJ34393.1 TupA-like ATPgrasp [Fibrobacter sp. UWP2]
MERDSLAYKIRRKMQVMASKVMPDSVMSKFYFKVVLGKKLNLKNPQTFNEKLQWLKLNYLPKNTLVVQCADKYRVREFIKQKGFEDKLVPLLGDWDDARKIDWSKLPKKFVLKCNHGCAYNILCADKETFDKNNAVKQLNAWMKEDFGAFNIERHYSKIEPHITCEEYLGDNITDYKYFCFNGEPKFIYVSTDLVHDRQAQIGFFYLDGSKMPLKRDDYTDIPSVNLPSFFNEMTDMAKDLCRDFPFVRVDFFIANNRYYFAELTFTPSACMMPFNPDKYDLEWGQMLDIESLKNK